MYPYSLLGIEAPEPVEYTVQYVWPVCVCVHVHMLMHVLMLMQFAWTHMTILVISTTANFATANLLRGLIWCARAPLGSSVPVPLPVPVPVHSQSISLTHY